MSEDTFIYISSAISFDIRYFMRDNIGETSQYIHCSSYKHTSHEETPGSSVAGKDWLPPLPKATPSLTSGVVINEYAIAFPSNIGLKRSCMMQIKLYFSENRVL